MEAVRSVPLEAGTGAGLSPCSLTSWPLLQHFQAWVPCWILMGPGEIWGKPYGSNRWQAQALPAELVSSSTSE